MIINYIIFNLAQSFLRAQGFLMNISIPIFSEENVTKMSQLQNEPKTNPNEPNFLEVFGGKTLILA